MKPSKVEKVKGDVDAAQVKLNDEKTWILDAKVKAEGSNARATLLVARKYVKNAKNELDEAATLKAIETGILADVKRVLPSAQFSEEAAKTLTALEKDALVQAGQPAERAGWPTKGQSDERYLSVKIVVDYPGGG